MRTVVGLIFIVAAPCAFGGQVGPAFVKGVPAASAGFNAASVASALERHLQEAAPLASSPTKLAEMLSVYLAAPRMDADLFAAQIFDRGLTESEALPAIRAFIKSAMPGQPRVSERIGAGLAKFTAPYHKDGRKRRAFVAASEKLRRQLTVAAPLGSGASFDATLASFFDGSSHAQVETGLVRVDVAESSRKQIPLAKSTRKREPDPRPEPQALQVVSATAVKLKEEIVLQDRFSQFPVLHSIDSERVKNHSITNDDKGDHVSVLLRVTANPNRASAGTQALQTRPAGAIAKASSEAMLRRYVEDSPSARPLDAASVAYIVKTLIGNRETMADAERHWLSVRPDERPDEQLQNESLLKLTNEGLGRHFRFIPESRNAPVDARVLDLHRQNSLGGFFILIEWMSDVGSDGVRVRHIGLLKPAELETAYAVSETQRREIAAAFEDSLSPNEIKTRKLAHALKIATFGYTNMGRVPGGTSSHSPDPLSMMSNITHLAIFHQIERRFGSIVDLMTPEEEGETLTNAVDIMARLNPRYVLNRFDSRGDGFEYAFAITEDGQLKVTPHGRAGMNLKPQNIRLAHGRRVFAAGTFTIERGGNLNLLFESNNYQDVDARWEVGGAFQTPGNHNLNAFITAAFKLQTDREVGSIGNRPVESYVTSRPDASEGDRAGGARRSRPKSSSHGFDSDEAYQFVKDIMGDAAAPPVKKFEWDARDVKVRPLDWKEWLKQSEQSGREHDKKVRLDWAHYVLRTSPDMSMSQIKTTYLKLAVRFHPDRNPGDASALEASKSVNLAFDAIDDELKQP